MIWQKNFQNYYKILIHVKLLNLIAKDLKVILHILIYTKML